MRILGLYSGQIDVSCVDGVEVIKRYGRRAKTFIYADPPYFEKAGSLYMNTFSADDHLALSETLNRIANRPWLLTYDDVGDVHELYSERRRRSFDLHYSAHRVTRATEIAILSDHLADIGEGWTGRVT